MKYAIIISNGRDYSSWECWTVACCNTLEQAKKAVEDFKKWKKEFLKEYEEQDWEGHLDEEKLNYNNIEVGSKDWEKISPQPPFGAGLFEIDLFGDFRTYCCIYTKIEDLGESK